MVEFNIIETGNYLTKILEEELGSKSVCRLTLDVQIPPALKGDRDGLCRSVISICKFLGSDAKNLAIDIELLKAAQNESLVRLKVDVRGSHINQNSTKFLLSIKQKEIDILLGSLPYETVFYHRHAQVLFSFMMTFQYDGSINANSLQNKKILLCEEDALSGLVFTSFLEEWGCEVTRVANGFSAIEEARSVVYHAILIDLRTPNMAGYDAIREIRKFDRHTPIFGLTSSHTREEFAIAAQSGATDIIVKPISGEELRRALTQYI